MEVPRADRLADDHLRAELAQLDEVGERCRRGEVQERRLALARRPLHVRRHDRVETALDDCGRRRGHVGEDLRFSLRIVGGDEQRIVQERAVRRPPVGLVELGCKRRQVGCESGRYGDR